MLNINQDIVEGKWNQVRGGVREKWGEITDSDLDRVVGRRDQLLGLLQEKYGYGRAQASAELDKFVNSYTEKRDAIKETTSNGWETAKPYALPALGVAAVIGAVAGVAYYLISQRDSA